MDQILEWLSAHKSAAWLAAGAGLLGSLAAVGLLILGVVAYIAPNDPAIVVLPVGQESIDGAPILTATIDSYRYEHAQSTLSGRDKDWQIDWIDALDGYLEREEKTQEFREAAGEAMEGLTTEKWRRDIGRIGSGIGATNHWYDVSVSNDGSIPLKDVFLRVNGIMYWVDKEEGRLTYAGNSLVIGDLSQKETRFMTIWVEEFRFGKPPEIVLGHANGLGVVTLNRH